MPYFCRTSNAGLEMLSQKVQIDRSGQQVHFTLVFDHVPDFQDFDSFGRPQDSFQYEIVPDTAIPINQLSFGDIRAVIRGDEIGSGNLLPIRNGIQNGSDNSATSGGWGTIRANVPFELTGNELTFTTNFNALDTTTGLFSYRVFTTNFGSTVSLAQSVSVPLPPALPVSCAILAVLGMVGAVSPHYLKKG